MQFIVALAVALDHCGAVVVVVGVGVAAVAVGVRFVLLFVYGCY